MDVETHSEDAGWEEYYEYIFPDDQETKKEMKIISKAMKWFQENPQLNNPENQ